MAFLLGIFNSSGCSRLGREGLSRVWCTYGIGVSMRGDVVSSAGDGVSGVYGRCRLDESDLEQGDQCLGLNERGVLEDPLLCDLRTRSHMRHTVEISSKQQRRNRRDR
ncbi:hypothetical protein Tco_0868651 [Tanacetum coccineum]